MVCIPRPQKMVLTVFDNGRDAPSSELTSSIGFVVVNPSTLSFHPTLSSRYVSLHVVSLQKPSSNINKENPDKVTGSLPDMGEYIGLYKLHSMTLDVGEVYPFGAQVTVASDGAVFNGT
jgi:hypothetical protein